MGARKLRHRGEEGGLRSGKNAASLGCFRDGSEAGGSMALMPNAYYLRAVDSAEAGAVDGFNIRLARQLEYAKTRAREIDSNYCKSTCTVKTGISDAESRAAVLEGKICSGTVQEWKILKAEWKRFRTHVLYPCMFVMAVSIPSAITDQLPLFSKALEKNDVDVKRLGVIITAIAGSAVINGLIHTIEYRKLIEIKRDVDEKIDAVKNEMRRK